MRHLAFIVFILFCPVASSTNSASKVLFTDLTGHTIPLDSLKGKWVLINYWASWCQPCLDEITELNRFYAEKKDSVALFAVNYDRLPLADQMALIKKYHINYPSLQHDPAPALNLGTIRGVPVTFVYNPAGKLSDSLYGGQTALSLSRSVA